MRQGKPVTVYVVTYNCDGPGQYGDGIAHYRTRSKVDAERFAVGKRCYAGPATAVCFPDTPRHVAARWGLV